jgi:hypothetical protein
MIEMNQAAMVLGFPGSRGRKQTTVQSSGSCAIDCPTSTAGSVNQEADLMSSRLRKS